MLINDGQGVGEGIVIKNYEFYNSHRQQIWAKIVTSEFKEKHHKYMGAPVSGARLIKTIEIDIVDTFVTSALVEKEHAKLVNENGCWSSRMIPQLLNTVFYELIREESWNMISKFKLPTIDYNRLKHLTVARIKEVKPDLF